MFSNLLQSKVSKASHHFCVDVLEEKIIFLKKIFYKTFFYSFPRPGDSNLHDGKNFSKLSKELSVYLAAILHSIAEFQSNGPCTWHTL